MVKPPCGIFIGLGSNLGEREWHIRQALAELDQDPEISVLAVSTLHETKPEGGPPGQPSFLNAVAELATTLTPRALLERMQTIEARHGRQRAIRHGPRTLDLDLLIYRNLTISEPDLIVPHPRMWQRAFVMEPLAEVCDLGRLVAARQLRPAPRPAVHTAPLATPLRMADSAEMAGACS